MRESLVASDTSTNWRWKNRLHPTPCILTRRKLQLRIVSVLSHGGFFSQIQWLFLVPLIGGRYHIIPQLAVYTTYIYCQLGDYMVPTTCWGNQETPLTNGFWFLKFSQGLGSTKKKSAFSLTHDFLLVIMMRMVSQYLRIFSVYSIALHHFGSFGIPSVLSHELWYFFNFMLGGDSSQTKIWDFTWPNNVP